MNTEKWLDEMVRLWGRGDELALSLWQEGYHNLSRAVGGLLAAHCDARNAERRPSTLSCGFSA